MSIRQSVACWLGHHMVPGSQATNGGIVFGVCPYCDADLIRVQGRWTDVPKDMQVIWRTRSEALKLVKAVNVHEPAPPAREALPDSPHLRKLRSLVETAR